MATEKQMKESYEQIFDALEGLTNGECIVQLEIAKQDILLNDHLVVLDGKSGRSTNKKNNFNNIVKKEEH